MAFNDLGNKKPASKTTFQSGWQTAIAGILSIFFITLPFVFTWVNDELFEVPKMLYTYAFTILLVAIWGLRMVSEKRFIFRRTFLDLPLLLFLISQIISTILSMHPRTSLLGYYSRLNGGLLSTLSYLAIYYVAVSNLTLLEVKKILTRGVFASILISLYGILEHFGHSFSCLIITGKFGVSCWVQNVRDRVFATFGQPNWLAAYAVTLLPLSLVLTTELKSRLQKSFAFIAGILLFTVLLFTGSRSGFIAAVLGLIIVIGCQTYHIFTSTPKKPLNLKTFRPTLIILASFLVISLIFGTRYTPSFTEIKAKFAAPTASQTTTTATPTPSAAPQEAFSGDISNDTGEIRKIVWQGALDIWKRYPLFGSGVETFAYSYYLDRPMAHNQMFEWDYLYNKAHNEFLNYLATTGIFGLGTYLLIFAIFGFCSLKVIMSNRSPHSNLLAAALAGTAALAVSNFFGFSTVACQVLQFLLLALSALIISEQSTTNDKAVKKSTPQTASFSWISLVIIAAAIFALTSVWRYWYGDFLYARGKSYISNGQSLRGLEYIISATKVSPNEALYYNDLSDFFAQLAATYYASDDETTKKAGLTAKDQTLAYLEITQKLNPVHLNFFKTRTHVYTALAVFDEKHLTLAKENLEQAMSLAPTDPKLVYQYSQLLAKLGEPAASEKYLRQALAMRPSYHEVRQDLAKLEESRGQTAAALEHYQYILTHITPDDKQAQAALVRLASGSAQIAPPANATESTVIYE